MKKFLIVSVGAVLLASSPAHAIDAKYREKLERSGCTQVTEMQGCDINKTKAENAKAGFVTAAPAENAGQRAQANQSPYAGSWVAIGPSGDLVADIHINNKKKGI